MHQHSYVSDERWTLSPKSQYNRPVPATLPSIVVVLDCLSLVVRACSRISVAVYEFIKNNHPLNPYRTVSALFLFCKKNFFLNKFFPPRIYVLSSVVSLINCVSMVFFYVYKVYTTSLLSVFYSLRSKNRF